MASLSRLVLCCLAVAGGRATELVTRLLLANEFFEPLPVTMKHHHQHSLRSGRRCCRGPFHIPGKHNLVSVHIFAFSFSVVSFTLTDSHRSRNFFFEFNSLCLWL